MRKTLWQIAYDMSFLQHVQRVWMKTFVLGSFTEEALNNYRKLLDIDSKSGPALIGLGIQSFQDKKYEEAEKNLTAGKQ